MMRTTIISEPASGSVKMPHEWQSDWQTFIISVSEMLSTDVALEQILEKFCNIPVQWEGEVLYVRLDDPFHVQLQMHKVDLRLHGGKHCVTDFLNLNINQGDAHKWSQIAVGDRIRFKTTLSRGSHVFPGIDWADLGDNRGYISIATKDSELLK